MSGEARRTFECFGGIASVNVGGRGPEMGAEEAALGAEQKLLDAHGRLSRFLPDSELSALNRDPRPTVPASRLLIEVAAVARWAGMLSDGLVDATLVGEIEEAGYRESLAESPPTGSRQTMGAPTSARAPASAGADRRLAQGHRRSPCRNDHPTARGPDRQRRHRQGPCRRPCRDIPQPTPQLRGRLLRRHPHRRHRTKAEDGPRRQTTAAGSRSAEMEIALGAVATSGIGRRTLGRTTREIWPITCSIRPAALPPTRASSRRPRRRRRHSSPRSTRSTALLCGPEETSGRLPHGGVILLEDGTVEAISGTQRLQAVAG